MFLKRRGKSKRRRVRNFRDPQNLQMLPSSLLPSCIISLTFILVFLDSDLCAVWHLLTHLKAGGNGMFVFSSWEEAEGATSRYGCSTYGRSLSTTIWCTSSCEYYSLVPLGWMFSLCFVLVLFIQLDVLSAVSDKVLWDHLLLYLVAATDTGTT